MAKIKMGYVMYLETSMGMNAYKIWSNKKTLVEEESLSALSICSLEQKLSWKLPWE